MRPSKPSAIVAGLIVGALLIGADRGVPIASSDSPPPTVGQLKAKIRQQANRIGDLKDEVDAQDAVISDQNDTITRLRSRDPLDAVLARSPDGLWNAVVALYAAFPTLEAGQLCGYDKTNSPGTDVGLTLTSFQFDRWSGC